MNPDDYTFLFLLATSPTALVRWRHRGALPAPEQFPHILWQGTLTQNIIFDVRTEEPIGLVQAYNPDHRNGHVALALIVSEKWEGSGLAIEACAMFLNYLFGVWNFRKIYMDTVEFNAWQFWSGRERFFSVEGCMRDHEFHDGKYWHLYTLAIYRDAWIEKGSRLLGVPYDSTIIYDGGPGTAPL